MALKESQVGHVSRVVTIRSSCSRWVQRYVGLDVGQLIAHILVPLTSWFVRRENVIPYIMGANITTLIDTLLAAVLLTTMKRSH